ncbi:MAG: amino acid adenylation domain-containing protein, partial [bacterium]|nr:amino acid adenylation domain-containing protein [bacterium]
APIPLQYKDYSQWQNSRHWKDLRNEQEAYWLKQFEGEIPVLNLPIDYSRPPVWKFEGKTTAFEIGKEETKQLRHMAVENNSTLFMILLATYNILLSKLSGQERIVIGTPVMGRPHADLQPIIGIFINTLALKSNPTGEKKVNRYLEEITHTTLKALENQEYPFENLVDNITGITRDTGRNPLFDVMFSYQEAEDTAIEIPGLTLKPYEYENSTAKFALTFICKTVNGMLEYALEYSTKLFKPATIHRIISYYKKVVTGILAAPHKSLAELEILSEAEKHQLLVDFNSEATGYTADKTIDTLFREQVAKTPGEIALTGTTHGRYPKTTGSDETVNPATPLGETPEPARSQLTYKELNDITDRLAHNLHRQGVGEGENRQVGLLTDRTVEMIISQLAILKTGSAYVPLNPKAPAERNRYMMQECKVNHLLTVGTMSEMAAVVAPEGEIIYIEEHIEEHGNEREENKEHKHQKEPEHQKHQKGGERIHTGHQPNANNTAYVIFTSGSTGKPKGVPITHSNLSPLLHWGYKHLGIGPQDRAIQNLSYYFDWSVWEIFITLTTGAALYMIPDQQQMNPEACVQFITENKITLLHATPTQWQYLLPSQTGKIKKEALQSIRYLCIGAEKLTLDLVKRSIGVVTEECRIFNMYGPTEATIISTVLEIEKTAVEKYENLSSVPIGEPTGNTDLLVLDKNMKPVPVHVEGELYIGGEGVAHGYLNNQELTAERFIKVSEQLTIGSRQEEASWQYAEGSRQEEKETKKENEPEKGAQTMQSVNSPTNKSLGESGTLAKPVLDRLSSERVLAPGEFAQPRVAGPPEACFYRTGDRVRWLTDGTVEYLGR